MISINSTHNQKVKRLLSLQQKSSERSKEGRFVVEGKREIVNCLHAGFTIETLFVCPQLCPSLPSGLTKVVDCYEVLPQVYAKMAYRESTEGLIATVCSKQLKLCEIDLTERPLLIVLERVEKPGNMGAVIRSAEAAGADAVIVCDTLTDLYNPNLIRASIGAVFTVPCVTCTSDECIRFLKERHINILTAQLQDSRPYYDSDMYQPTAIVMGNESTGLSKEWREAATEHIRIPMAGRIDSLNVSVSAAILLFEAVRQRRLM